MVTPCWSFLGMNVNTEIKTGAKRWSAGKNEPAPGHSLLCGMGEWKALWSSWWWVITYLTAVLDLGSLQFVKKLDFNQLSEKNFLMEKY